MSAGCRVIGSTCQTIGGELAAAKGGRRRATEDADEKRRAVPALHAGMNVGRALPAGYCSRRPISMTRDTPAFSGDGIRKLLSLGKPPSFCSTVSSDSVNSIVEPVSGKLRL